MLKGHNASSPRLRELKKERSRSLKNKILIFFLLIFAVLALLVWFLRWPRINVSAVSVSGNKVVDAKQIEKLVTERLAGRYLWLIPKSNFLIYPKRTVKKELAKEFPRLLNINLHLTNIKSLEVTVTEREPKYSWCGEEPTSKEECYFMDQAGFIFGEAPYFSGNVYFKFYGKKEESETGTYYAKDNFKEMVDFKNTLEKIGLQPVGLYFISIEEARMLLEKKSNTKNPEVVFKPSGNLGKAAENLQAALAAEPLKSNFANKYSSLEYIDLRFGNKVYYKFRE